MKHLITQCFSRILLLALSAVIAMTAAANERKTMLILDSYHEDELWGNSMVQPILNHYSHSDSVKCDVMYLNCATVPNDSVYNVICDNVFGRYSEHQPDCVLMLGNFAFNLRDRIKEEWGEIPILVITRSEGFGPLQDYFISNSSDFSLDIRTPLSSVREDYNFTVIFVPDYTRQSVDLMMSMIPDMDRFVFIGDESYVNQVCAFNLYNYILEEYPAVKFKWLKATEANAEEFHQYISVRDPKLGILLSSWTYEIESTFGYPVLTVRDLNMVSTSVNPVFTTRLAYMSLGCVGGIFSDFDEVINQALWVVSQMLEGKTMHDIPFYYPKNYYAEVDYQMLKKYGLNVKNCPKDTVIINRPQTYFERYWLVICAVGMLLISLLVLMSVRNSEQRKKISILRRHSDFVNNMPIPYTCALISVEMGGKIKNIKYTERNLAFDRIVGDNYTSKEAINVLPDDELVKYADEMIAEPKPKTFTYHFDHTDTYYDFALYPIEVKEKGEIRELYVDVFVLDITTNHKLQMGLEESAKVLDMAIDVANLLPYKLLWDKKTLLFDIIKAFVSNFDSEYKGKSVPLSEYLKRIHPDDLALFNDTIEKLDKGEISKFCIQYRMYDTTDPKMIRWFENRGAVSSHNVDGAPTLIIGTLRNITEAKEHEAAMSTALAKAEESDRVKSTFLANMSHEIRTPLNAIVGFSSMMVKEKDEATKAKLADVINKNNDLLLTLINDVLDLAKIESNTIELMPSVCDINDLIDSIGKTMSIRLPKDVKLNTVFFFDKCVVETDVSRLSQILINLLTNACKFTKKGSITVGYELRKSQNMLYFFVRDTGIGISAENIERIFGQFVKLDSFAQGTGLGLAICRKLIEKMGGEIGAESEGEGFGSKFWFTLPYKPVELEEIPDDEAAEDAKAEEAELDSETETEIAEIPESEGVRDSRGNLKPLILVAEDNDSNFWLMKHMLSPMYRTVNAENGKEAVKMFKKLNPDIIIMDINMPEMDGYKAVEMIRKISTTVPIIAVTAYAFASDRIRILNSGFDAYVPKPVTEIAIISAINQVAKKDF